jgi:SAM-dependent methyltransferase
VVARDAEFVRVRYRGSLGPLAAIRLYDACGVTLAPIEAGAAPSVETVLARLHESLAGGLLSALVTAEPVRFRVSPLRLGRWEVRDALARELGWVNDPSRWDVNLEVMGSHLAAQVGALYWSRRFAKLARVPASTNPVVAALMIRLLAPEGSQLVCDPCCGAGTLLFEAAAAVPGIRTLGGDISRPALAAARRNLGAGAPLYRGDARFLPLAGQTVQRLVCNLPFGKRVGSHRQNVEFYPAFLSEVDRVLAPGGRALALTEEKRLFRQAAGATGRLRIDRELTLTTGGLHPSVFVLRPATN